MHKQLVIVLLVGFAASVYSLDLSHAAKRSTETEIEPRIFSFITDFYADVLFRPLNHIVTNLALLGAQALAGLSENGLPNPNGRTDYPSEAQLRGFWDSLWNNAVKPPMENAISSMSLMLAQALAGIGNNGISLPGKRDLTEAEMRGFFDDLANTLLQLIQKPLQDAAQTAALLGAQVLAGIGTNGIDLSSIFGTVGKRDLTEAEMRGFLDDLANTLLQLIQKPLQDAAQTAALLGAQVLAGIATNGIDLSSIFGTVGKRDLSEAELRGFFGSLGSNILNGLQATWNNVLQGPIQDAIQTASLLAAQVLAGIGSNGISLPGKRDLTAEPRGPVIDGIVSHATGLYNDQVKPLIENAINNAVLHLAGIMANFSQGTIGRRSA